MSVEKLQELVGYQRDIQMAWDSVKDVPARVTAYLELIKAAAERNPEDGTAAYVDECKAAYYLVMGHCNEIEAWHEKGEEIIKDLSRTYAAQRMYRLNEKEEKRADELADRYRQFADRVDRLVVTIREFAERFASEAKNL